MKFDSSGRYIIFVIIAALSLIIRFLAFLVGVSEKNGSCYSYTQDILLFGFTVDTIRLTEAVRWSRFSCRKNGTTSVIVLSAAFGLERPTRLLAPEVLLFSIRDLFSFRVASIFSLACS